MKFITEQKIPFTKRKFYIAGNIGILPQRPERTAGMLNRTKDNYFLPFFDWDRLAYEFLEIEAKTLMKEFNLSDLYVFHAKDHPDGWNCMTLDKLNFWDCYAVINRSTCDRNYKRGCFYTPSRAWTMRFAEKGERDRIEYYGVIPSDIQVREKSRAHSELIQAVFAKVNWDGKFDNYHIGDIITEAYNTGSHTTKDSLKEEMTD